MKNVNECSLKERGDYNEAQQDAIDTHSRGIAKLKVRNTADDIEEDEYQENLAKIADLKVARGILRARREAYYASHSAINPPTDPQLERIKDDLNSVNKLTVERRIVKEVVSLTTDALNTFRKIQPS